MRGLFITCLVAAFATTAIAGELLKDPDKAAAWRVSKHGTAALTMTEDQGVLRFDTTQIDGNERNALVYQVLTGARSQIPYTLRFSAKASAPRAFTVFFRQGEKPYRFVASPPPVQLTTEWKQFVLPVQFDPAADGKSVFGPAFVLGAVTGTVWVKNVSVWDDSLGLAAAKAPAEQPESGEASANLLHNPLELKTWAFEQRSGAKAILSNADDGLKVVVDKAGKDSWDVQMFTSPADIKTTGSYTLEVAMRADTPRKISLLVTDNTPPYTRLVPSTAINIDTQLKMYRITIPLTTIPASGVRMPVFGLGSSTGTIWLRPVSLTKAASAK